MQIYSGTYTSTTLYLGAPAEINILDALPPPTMTSQPVSVTDESQAAMGFGVPRLNAAHCVTGRRGWRPTPAPPFPPGQVTLAP